MSIFKTKVQLSLKHPPGSLSTVIAQAIHPDDRQKVEESNLSVIKDKKPIPLEYRVIWPDKSVHTVWAEGGELVVDQEGKPASFSGFVQDITERKRAEMVLRKQEDFGKNITELSPVGIAMLDREGNIVYANARAEAILGLSRRNISTLAYNSPTFTITNIQGGEFPEEQLPFQQVRTQQKTIHDIQHAIAWPDGKKVMLSINAAPLFDEGGHFDGIIASVEDITERKHAEDTLLAERAFRNSIELSLSSGIVIVDDQGRQTYVNPSFCKLFGWTEKELIGRTAPFAYWPADQLQVIGDAFRLTLADKAPKEGFELEFVRKDGVRIPAQVIISPFSDGKQRIGWLANVIDITERKGAENELQQSEAFLNESQKLANMGSWEFDLANQQVNWSDNCYALYGVSLHEFEPSFEYFQSVVHPDDVHVVANAFEDAVKNRKPNVSELRIVCPDGTIKWMHSSMVPIIVNDNVAKLRGVQIDITERKLAEDKIREKDLQFRKLSSHVPDLIYQFTRRPDGSYFVPIASVGIKNIFGCSPEDVLEDFAPIGRVIFPEDAARVIDDIEYSAKHLTLFTCEFRVQIPGKAIQWILSRSTPEQLPDGSVTWYGFNADITDRKRAEETLRQSEMQLNMAQTMGVTGSWVYNLDTDKIWGSAEGLRIFGYHPVAGDFPISDIETCIPERERVHQALVDLIEKGTKYDLEYAINPADGSLPRVIHSIATIEKDAQGRKRHVLGFIQDITERKRSEDALLESEMRYRTLFEKASEGIFYLSIDLKLVAVNTSFARMHGYAAEEMQNVSLQDLDTPETSAGLPDRMRRIMSGEAIEFEVEHYHKDGHVFPLAVSASLISAGGEQLIQAFHRDISDRKRVEAVLQESEIKYRTLVETTQTGFLILDSHGRVLDANREYVRLTGHSDLSEIQGRSVVEWTAEYEKQRNAEAVAQCVRDGNIRDLVIDYADASGHTIPVEINATVLKKGTSFHIISLCRDITERKKDEDQLRRTLEEKNVLLREVHHRVKNNLTVISSLLNMQSSAIHTPEQAMTAFKNSRDRIAAMSLVHGTLYESKDYAQVAMDTYLERLTRQIVGAYGSDENIHMDAQAHGIVLGVDTSIPCGLILTELITNSFKHAFPDGHAGEIRVVLRAVDDDSFELLVSDNGIGLPVGYEGRETLGLSLVRLLTEQIEGTMNISAENGTRCVIRFPRKAERNVI